MHSREHRAGADDARVFTLRNLADMDAIKRTVDERGATRAVVVGGGYIGLELGSVYAALGSRVSVVEMTDGLLPGVDRDLVALHHTVLGVEAVLTGLEEIPGEEIHTERRGLARLCRQRLDCAARRRDEAGRR